jgi:hypothetical protein
MISNHRFKTGHHQIWRIREIVTGLGAIFTVFFAVCPFSVAESHIRKSCKWSASSSIDLFKGNEEIRCFANEARLKTYRAKPRDHGLPSGSVTATRLLRQIGRGYQMHDPGRPDEAGRRTSRDSGLSAVCPERNVENRNRKRPASR